MLLRRPTTAALSVLTCLTTILAFGAVPARAATLRLAPSDDATVVQAAPAINFGSTASLEVDASPVKHFLLRFEVPATMSSIATATLRLHNVNPSSRGGDISASDAGWNESSVTWDSAPAPMGPVIASLGSVSAGSWYNVNVTSAVTGPGAVSFRVTPRNRNGADYASTEGTPGLAPELVLELASSSDVTPPAVTIDAPAAGATVSGTTTVTVTATDAVGVEVVELLVDGTPLGSDPQPPYSFAWDTVIESEGAHSLEARARDLAGNVGSAIIAVTVDNAADTTPPSVPAGLSALATSSTTVALQWQASTDDDQVASYSVLRDGVAVAQTSATSLTDTGLAPQTAYAYRVLAIDRTGNDSDPSDPVMVTTPSPSQSFRFAAAGDIGASSNTDASLAALDVRDPAFFLALGDLRYGLTATDQEWCDYITAGLPTLGPAFPFQLVAGNHEEQGHTDGDITQLAQCLPDRMGSTLGTTNRYAAEYFFDYPPSDPTARVITISPDLPIDGVSYDYSAGTSHHTWVRDTIDDARARDIPWIIVGMHKNCINAGGKSCEIGEDLFNLLVDRKVDLILQGHAHNYERSVQLALDPATCPAIQRNQFDPDCVVDDGSDRIYSKGAGSLLVIAGSFGRGPVPVDPADLEAPYFAKLDDSTHGFVSYDLSPEQLDATFVNSVGPFTDAFSIISGPPPPPDEQPPTPPSQLEATVVTGNQVDLAWGASSDDTAVDRYLVYRDGAVIATTVVPGYQDFTATAGADHTYHVTAKDPAGNESDPSNAVTVSTPTGAGFSFVTIADATVQANKPDARAGMAPTLEVDLSARKDFLLTFDVRGIGSASIVSARLRLYNVDASGVGGHVHRVDAPGWDEATITWANAPPASGSVIASFGSVANGWHEVDVTAAVTGDGPVGFRVQSSSSNGADYISKDGTAGLAPVLLVATS